MNKSRQRKLIERGIIFSITFTGVLFFLIFDFGFVYPYKIDGYKDLQWFGFWTHLSNMAAMTWITLALIAVTMKNDKLERWIQHWNIKNTVYTFIIVTGAVFIVVAYFPVIILYFKGGNVEELTNFVKQLAYEGELSGTIQTLPSGMEVVVQGKFAMAVVTQQIENGRTIFYMKNGSAIDVDPTMLYRSCVILGTTFKHVIIPGMFVFLAFTELGYYRTKNMNDFNRTMIQFIWPSLYLVYVTLLTSSGLISPPYPVLDFGFTQSFYEMTVFNQSVWILVSLLLDLMVGFIYIFVSMFQNHWNKVMCEKHGIESHDEITQDEIDERVLVKA